MTNTEPRARFRAWLVAHKYSPSTVQTALVSLQAFAAGKRETWLVPDAKRIAAAFEGEALGAQAAAFVDAYYAARPALSGRVGRTKPRQRAFDDEAWSKLVGALSADETPAGRVLDLIGATGLRIGDVLRVTAQALEEGWVVGAYVLRLKGDKPWRIEHAAAPTQWTRLHTLVHDHKAPDVASLVSPGSKAGWLPGGAAYQRVRRRLVEHCKQLDIEERVWLHRMRKTVGEQIYEMTGDLVAVRDALGHENISTSAHYVNPDHAARTTALQQARQAKFRKP